MNEKNLVSKCPFCGYPVEVQEHAPGCPSTTLKGGDAIPDSEGTAFQQKTPARLEQQFRFASAQRAEKYPRPDRLPEPPAEFFGLSGPVLKARLDSDPQLLAQYTEYLQALRKMKLENKIDSLEHSDQAMNKMVDGEKPPSALLERIFSAIKGGGKFFDEKIFRDEQITKAINDPERFFSLVKNTALGRSGWFLKHFDKISPLFSEKEVREIIGVAVERSPRDALFFAKYWHTFCDDEQFSDLVEKAYDQAGEGYSNYIIANNQLRQRVSSELQTKLVNSSQPDNLFVNIDELITEGLINPDQARKTFLRFASGELSGSSSEVGKVFDAYLKFFTGEHKTELQQVLKTRLEKGYLSIYDIETFRKTLGDEWRREMVLGIAEKRPEDLMGQKGMFDDIISTDEVEAKLQAKLSATSNARYGDYFDMIRHQANLTPATRKLLAAKIMEILPGLALQNWSWVQKEYSESDRPRLVQELIQRSPYHLALQPELIKELPGLTDQQQLEKLREYILNDPSFEFLDHYTEPGKAEWLRRAIPSAELSDFVIRKAEINPSGLQLRWSALRQALGSDEQLEALVRKMMVRSPQEMISNFKQVAYLFPESESETLLEDLVRKNPQVALSNLDSLYTWVGLLKPDVANDLLNELINKYPTDALMRLHNLGHQLPVEGRKEKIITMVANNPPVALSMVERVNKFVPEFDEAAIINSAQSDRSRVAMAPASIGDFFKNFARAKTDEQRNAILREGYEIYNSIEVIQQAGQVERYLELSKKSIVSKSDELRYLELAQAFVMSKTIFQPESSGQVELPESFSDMETVVYEQVAEICDAKELNTDQRRQATEAFGGAVPLLLYLRRHWQHPELMPLLKKVFNEAGTGHYHAWRFDLGQPLDQAQAEGRLPKRLTEIQRDKWATDEATDISSVLEVNAADIAARWARKCKVSARKSPGRRVI